MNKNIELIDLRIESNRSWYTIASKVTIEGKYIRQTSSMDCFAIVNLNIEPDYQQRQAIFQNKISEIDMGNLSIDLQENNDDNTISILNTIDRGICQGIKKACVDLKNKSYLVAGIKVTAIAAKYHPIDSRSLCYELATHSALLKVFEEVDLIEI